MFMFEDVVKFVVFLGLSIAFMIQVEDSVVKFVNGKTAVGTSLKPVKGEGVMYFPQISICSQVPFKNDKLLKYNLSPFVSYEERYSKWPNTAEQVELAWQQSTHDLADFLKSIYLFNGSDVTKCHFPDFEACQVIIKPVNTVLNGKCFSIFLNHSVEDQENLILLLHNNPGSSVQPSIFLHAPGEEVSLAYQYWYSDVFYAKLRPNSELDLKMSLALMILEPRLFNAKIGQLYRDFFRCVALITEKAIFNETLGNQICRDSAYFGNCTIPQLSIFGQQNQKVKQNYCITNNTASCATQLAETVLRRLTSRKDIEGCKRPPAAIMYKVKPSEIDYMPGSLPNTSAIWMVYSSSSIVISEDYVLFDAFAIIGSVGGSLGLFLGFSCFDCFNRLWNFTKQTKFSIYCKPKNIVR